MKRVLIRRVDNLGDILIFIPALKILRKHFCSDHLTLMVKQSHHALVKEYADAFEEPATIEDFKLLSDQYDHIINVEYSSPVDYIIPDGELPSEIHFGNPRGNKMKLHMARSICKNIYSHGIKGRFSNPKFLPDQEALRAAKEWLDKRNLTSSKLVISVHPNSGFDKKCWNLKGFISVCRYLIQELNATVIIPAVNENDTRALEILANFPEGGCHILGGYSIDIVAAIINNCDLHIGNDSGIGHLAAAVNVPVVIIFGPTDPYYWKPLTNKIVIVRKKDSECPGGYDHAKTCLLQTCLTEISVNDVIDGILMAFSNYIEDEKLLSVIQLKVSENISIKKTSKGYLLANKLTNHSCLIQKGWREVKQVLSEVENTNATTSMLDKKNEIRPLVDFLVMHRVLELKPIL
ncbi:MAG: glycosyltransferase family 9 protein [Bacteroidetes bacterium]|nr:glycosyltransferase family 9 protein [Bacteroidota bacterium]